MTTQYLQLIAHDPIVARDGRPFGVGQGNRMRGLAWPYPSVVAGSFRTALVKATGGDFAGDMPQKLMSIPVAGVFPVADGELYLPAPNDCVHHPDKGPICAVPDGSEVGGCDFPAAGLRPVMLSFQDSERDFKPIESPVWWPVGRLVDWLIKHEVTFDQTFLSAAGSYVRDHVMLEAETGAAVENRLFATAGLSLTHLPRFEVKKGTLKERYAEVTLSARVEAVGWDTSTLNILHPLGGERRLVHWQAHNNENLWKWPKDFANALAGKKHVRMVLATPAVFKHGWRPDWIDEHTLTGSPPGCPIKLTLVGLCIERWKAVSGWSLAEVRGPKPVPRGPKPVKRLVPAGGVYFFEANDDPSPLAERWLQPVSDEPQDCNDGFGLAVWGTW